MIDNAPLGDASCPSLSPLPCPPPRPLRQHPAHFRLRPVLALGGRYRARPVRHPGWAAGSNGTGSSVVTRTAVLPPLGYFLPRALLADDASATEKYTAVGPYT